LSDNITLVRIGRRRDCPTREAAAAAVAERRRPPSAVRRRAFRRAADRLRRL